MCVDAGSLTYRFDFGNGGQLLEQQIVVKYLHYLATTQWTAQGYIGGKRRKQGPQSVEELCLGTDHDGKFAALGGFARTCYGRIDETCTAGLIRRPQSAR